MGKKDFIIRTDDILGAEGKKNMKSIIDTYLATIAPDKDYETISIEFNNKTQKYDVYVKDNTPQKKIPIKNTIRG